MNFSMINCSPKNIFIIVLGIAVSCVHIDSFYYSHDIPKWAFFDIGLSFFIFYLAAKSGMDCAKFHTLGAINLAILLLMLASTYWASNPYAALEWTLRYGLACALVASLLHHYSAHNLTVLVRQIIVYSAAIFCLVFIIEVYILSVPRNNGTFTPIGFVNNAGHVLNIWIPVLTYLFLSNIKKARSVFYFSLLAILVHIIIDGAIRGSIVGLFLGEILVVCLLIRKNLKMALRFLSITTLLLLSLATSQLFESLRNERLTANLLATGARMSMFQNTWNMTIDNPIGVGANNFEYIHPKYARTGEKGKNSPFVNTKQILRTPHNYPLKVFSEIGFIGGALTLLLYVIIGIRALKNAIFGETFDKWLLVAVIAIGFHSLVSAVFSNPASLFFSALLVSLILKRGKKFQETWYFYVPIKKAIFTQVLAIPLLSLIWVSSNLYAFQGAKTYDADKLKQALALNPGNERALYDLSKVQYQKYRDIEGSLNSITRFIDLYPYHLKALFVKAQREIELHQLNDAKYTLNRLLTIYPTYKDAKKLQNKLNYQLNSK